MHIVKLRHVQHPCYHPKIENPKPTMHLWNKFHLFSMDQIIMWEMGEKFSGDKVSKVPLNIPWCALFKWCHHAMGWLWSSFNLTPCSLTSLSFLVCLVGGSLGMPLTLKLLTTLALYFSLLCLFWWSLQLCTHSFLSLFCVYCSLYVFIKVVRPTCSSQWSR